MPLFAGEAACNVNCTTGTMGMNCAVALTQSPCQADGLALCTNYPASQTMVTTMVISSMNAMCIPGTAGDSMALASHPSGSGNPASCRFLFRVARCSPMVPCTAGYFGNVACTVNDTDGLPVELMDFGVDEEEDEP